MCIPACTRADTPPGQTPPPPGTHTPLGRNEKSRWKLWNLFKRFEFKMQLCVRDDIYLSNPKPVLCENTFSGPGFMPGSVRDQLINLKSSTVSREFSSGPITHTMVDHKYKYCANIHPSILDETLAVLDFLLHQKYISISLKHFRLACSEPPITKSVADPGFAR